MRGSRLRHVIKIKRPVMTKDAGSNEPIKKYNAWREVSAEAVPRRGREFFEGGKRYAETVTRFTCRFFEVQGLEETDRITFDNPLSGKPEHYDIKAILPDLETQDEVLIEATMVK